MGRVVEVKRGRRVIDVYIASGGSGGAQIDDVTASPNTVYSSQKVEGRLAEEVGDQSLNFASLFRNKISQGGVL